MAKKQPWEHVPLQHSGPKLTRQAIDDAAKKLKLPFPEEYAAFLLARNGGSIDWMAYFSFPIEGCKRDTHGLLSVLYGIGPKQAGNDLANQYKTFRRRIPAGLLPVGNDLGGNLLCLACAGAKIGQVFFWEQAFEANTDEGDKVSWKNVFPVAASFNKFLLSLQPAED
jgi:hypothetical protein